MSMLMSISTTTEIIIIEVYKYYAEEAIIMDVLMPTGKDVAWIGGIIN